MQNLITNIYEQFITTPLYAFRLAKNKEFISKTGLDGIGLIKRMWQLYPRIGYVFAMRRTFHQIEVSYPNMDIDSKFAALIYSRIRMIPQISKQIDPELYSASGLKVVKDSCPNHWEEMSVYKKFLEVSLAVVMQEENLITNPVTQEMLATSEMLGENFWREFYSLLFSKIFKYKGWAEL